MRSGMVFLFAILFFGCERKEEIYIYEFPISSLRHNNNVYIPSPLIVCGDTIPIEKWWVRERLYESIRFFTASKSNRERVIRYLTIDDLYFPYIDKRTDEWNLPRELHALPIIESEFVSRAVSQVKAVGYWQFMPVAGREANMRMDEYVDERSEFERATDAALKKLQRENKVFEGDWMLTIAAYNWGVTAVRNALEFQNVETFFELDAPAEPTRFIFSFLAITCILRTPHMYDFYETPAMEVSGVTIYPYVTSRVLSRVHLAGVFGMSPAEFREYNPHLSRKLSPGMYRVRVPNSIFFVLPIEEKEILFASTKPDSL